jgi:hypothetical protein
MEMIKPAIVRSVDDDLGALAHQIKHHHQLAEKAGHEAMEHAHHAGKLLVQAKARVKHGEWLSWLQSNTQLQPRTAQRYMQFAKYDTVSHLNLLDGMMDLDLDDDEGRMAVSTAAVLASEPPDKQIEEATSPSNSPAERNENNQAQATPDPDADPSARHVKGKGIILAHEAINCLQRIPKNDALRSRGFQLVEDWIKRNK